MLLAAAPLPSADERLARQIAAHLAGTHRSSLKRLCVDVEGGQVTLRGRVRSFHEWQIAMQTCRRVTGHGQLRDAICVAARDETHAPSSSSLPGLVEYERQRIED